VPANVGLDQASFVTLGAISMEALRRTQTHFGEVVVVYGLGLLGLMVTQMAHYAGVRVIGLDIDPRRLEQAKRMGADLVLDPRSEDPLQAVRGFTNGFGADGVVLGIVDESSEPLNLSFEMTRHRGVVVGLGLFGMDIGRSRMFANDISFVGSRAYGPGRYDPVYEEGSVDFPIGYVRWTENRNQQEFLRELSVGAVTVDELAPIRVPIAEAPRAWELLKTPDRPATVLIDYGRGA
jgi:polar amino acid transport system substrate-binding protein